MGQRKKCLGSARRKSTPVEEGQVGSRRGSAGEIWHKKRILWGPCDLLFIQSHSLNCTDAGARPHLPHARTAKQVKRNIALRGKP